LLQHKIVVEVSFRGFSRQSKSGDKQTPVRTDIERKRKRVADLS